MPRVLLTYASPHGATRSIAERIASRLRERGLRVDCVPIERFPAIASYDAVVMGSALHDRAWTPEAAGFVNLHAADLAARPVWLFSVGMADALPRPARRLAVKEGPLSVAPFLDTVRPRDTRLFSGVVRKEQFPRMSRLVMRLTGARYGDFRDWRAIDAWAATIADELLARG
ncbi:flavodoxin [Nocardioides sp. dk4132]|uniref:flavodoxin domain-containing protein n=1 Tax=unclassified Nocardioides TaxID=2615069 RepID=UPI0012950EC1|nr:MULTISPECIES: flavodoxin domain-containing protein [unclassified Nocardioides]MQW74888.1 flavodoxin [Nocardioides sp. dk4132]QGA07921.1 flavodoxin [Nocardioides sp. dk884]